MIGGANISVGVVGSIVILLGGFVPILGSRATVGFLALLQLSVQLSLASAGLFLLVVRTKVGPFAVGKRGLGFARFLVRVENGIFTVRQQAFGFIDRSVLVGFRVCRQMSGWTNQ